MKHRSAIASIVAFVLVTQAAFVVQALERVRADIGGEVAGDVGDLEPEAGAVASAAGTGRPLLPPPGQVDVAARLALLRPSGLVGDDRSLMAPSPSPILSNNAKTVIIVAIIAGAVLILAGVVVLGKPFKP